MTEKLPNCPSTRHTYWTRKESKKFPLTNSNIFRMPVGVLRTTVFMLHQPMLLLLSDLWILKKLTTNVWNKRGVLDSLLQTCTLLIAERKFQAELKLKLEKMKTTPSSAYKSKRKHCETHTRSENKIQTAWGWRTSKGEKRKQLSHEHDHNVWPCFQAPCTFSGNALQW